MIRQEEGKRWWLISLMVMLVAAAVLVEPSEAVDMTGMVAGVDYVPGEVMVRFRPAEVGRQRTLREKGAIVANLNAGRIKRSFRIVPGLCVVRLPEGMTVSEAMTSFGARSEVMYVEPNYKGRFLADPCDPRFGDQWGMHNAGNDADIDAPEAWDLATDSDVVVAILDTGVDVNHEDLSGNIWVNDAEGIGDDNADGAPGIKGVDDDGDGLTDEDSNDLDPCDPWYADDLDADDDENGYADDFYGWDFYGGDNDVNDFPAEEPGHGTHVAGDFDRDGDVDAADWGVFRDYFQKPVPWDCGYDGAWPPGG